jgi:hypothetical protein
MKHKAKRGNYTWTDISSALVMVGICVAFASIILVLVLAWLDPIESETRVTGILTGVYQPPIDDSDVPPPVRLLVRLDASQERVEVPLSEPTPLPAAKAGVAGGAYDEARPENLSL